jgi:hypothetical protein
VRSAGATCKRTAPPTSNHLLCERKKELNVENERGAEKTDKEIKAQSYAPA